MSAARNNPPIRYDFYFHTTRDLLCVLGRDGRLLVSNQAFQEALGHDADSLEGVDFLSLVHPDDAEPVRAFLASNEDRDVRIDFEARFAHRELGHRRLSYSLRRLAGEAELYGSGIETYEQVSVEEWRKRRELFQKMQETAHVGGWEVDCLTGKQYWTEETYRIHHLSLDWDPLVSDGLALYAPESRPIITAAWNAAVTEGKPYDLELELINLKGQRLWVRTAGRPVLENGKVVRVLGAFQDIDAFKRRELELAEKLAIIEKQRSEIQALSVPIIQVWDDVLALPLVGGVDQARADEITARLLEAVVAKSARFTILDLTGVEAVDEETAERLVRILRAIRLLGAEGMVTGIRPAVAHMLATLGADFAGARTFSNLREAIKACMRERPSTKAPREGGARAMR
ncbi:STAS domain-containing protein [Polyangium aurulentum]|uniref:STAS domain-containing protein n=1 Tax=Polyangium aurulentum TaxID=2567896 RepID=UPI0010ADD7A5|nr:STAS domain-containing protein [Polyangium aurulentum]UQA57276.1 PAS domain-containing protein [Polyangium aurulentum]